MFVITKTFTDDEGHLFTKVNPIWMMETASW